MQRVGRMMRAHPKWPAFRGGVCVARLAFAPTPPYPARPAMSIMSDRWITRMAREHAMIEPFEDRQVREGVVSYGVSSYGYDMRVAREFRIFTNVMTSIVDPKEVMTFVDRKST